MGQLKPERPEPDIGSELDEDGPARLLSGLVFNVWVVLKFLDLIPSLDRCLGRENKLVLGEPISISTSDICAHRMLCGEGGEQHDCVISQC